MSRIANKIAFIGDAHLSSKSPSSRVDDYANTTLLKLDKLLELCKKNNLSYLVFLGDMFNTPTDTLLYVNRVMMKFKEFERNGIYVYSILGNHSVANMKHENRDKSSEGLLYTSKLVRELQYEPFISPQGYKIGLYGYHYSQPLGLPSKGDLVNICVAHKGYNEPYEGSLTKANCLEFGYDVYALGHFHQDYAIYKDSTYTVIRPGRFMRNTCDEYNYTNAINVDVLNFGGSIQRPLLQVERLKIPVDDYGQIFSTKVLTKNKDCDKYLYTLTAKVQSLMEKMEMSYESDENDIYRILDSLDIDTRVKNNIELYLGYQGINRRA